MTFEQDAQNLALIHGKMMGKSLAMANLMLRAKHGKVNAKEFEAEATPLLEKIDKYTNEFSYLMQEIAETLPPEFDEIL